MTNYELDILLNQIIMCLTLSVGIWNRPSLFDDTANQ